MFADQLLVFMLIACQIILNESYVTQTVNRAVANVISTSVTLPQGYTNFPDVNAAYKVHTTPMNWNEARDLCISEGGHLAIADTLEKIQHIVSLTDSITEWLHVGFYKINKMSHENWRRVDNDKPVSSLPWRGGSGWYDNCAGISLHRDGLLTLDCETSRELPVCEIPT